MEKRQSMSTRRIRPTGRSGKGERKERKRRSMGFIPYIPMFVIRTEHTYPKKRHRLQKLPKPMEVTVGVHGGPTSFICVIHVSIE